MFRRGFRVYDLFYSVWDLIRIDVLKAQILIFTMWIEWILILTWFVKHFVVPKEITIQDVWRINQEFTDGSE